MPVLWLSRVIVSGWQLWLTVVFFPSVIVVLIVIISEANFFSEIAVIFRIPVKVSVRVVVSRCGGGCIRSSRVVVSGSLIATQFGEDLVECCGNITITSVAFIYGPAIVTSVVDSIFMRSQGLAFSSIVVLQVLIEGLVKGLFKN